MAIVSAQQIICQLGTMLMLADLKAVQLRLMGVAQMRGARKQVLESPAIGPHAACRNAAEAHTVKGPLASDDQSALSLATCLVIGECHFHGRIGGLGTRIGEKDMVQIPRSRLGKPGCKIKGGWMAEQKVRCKIKDFKLTCDRFANAGVVVPGPAAPKARDSVELLTPIFAGEIGALRRDQPHRRGLGGTVRCIRHPKRGKIGCVRAFGHRIIFR
jgi:hypothetical protein